MKQIILVIAILMAGCQEIETDRPLFFIYGQSNGAGSSVDLSNQSMHGDMWDAKNKYAVPVKDPSRYDGKNFGSAWPTFADAYFSFTNRNPVIINASFGGKKMESLVYGSDENFIAMDMLQTALDYYGDEISDVYMIFVHGEGDARAGTNFDDYFNGLESITEQIKQITKKYRKTYIHRVGLNRSHNDVKNWLAFGDEQMNRTKSKVDWLPVFVEAPLFSINNSNMEQDDIHYSLSGYKYMGTVMAFNIARYEAGEDIAGMLINQSNMITMSF